MKTGRNEPCPCGSGKKYKKCCLPKEEEEEFLEAESFEPEDEGPEFLVPAGPSVAPLKSERTLEDLRRIFEEQQFSNVEEANAYLRRLLQGGGRIPQRPARSDVERAQDLAYEAWEAGGAEGLALARKALEISADCADAHLYIAEHEEAPERRLEILRRAVAAGERALGPEAFQEDAGSFWGVLRTRPYMRARAALAQALWEAGQHEEALGHWREMLRLNPNDNQGIRYRLLAALLERGETSEIEDLLQRYEGDTSAEWLYGRALYLFRKHGDSTLARRARREARQANPHVLKYWLGEEPLPEEVPDVIHPGGEDEAAACAHALAGVVRSTPGAVEWLSR